MADQLNLFDLQEGRSRRDQALARVEAGSAPGWRLEAYQAVHRAALALSEFTTDGVWAFLPPGVEPPRERRAMGPIMLRARRAGLIAPTSRFMPSARPVSHAGPRRVWRSLIHDERRPNDGRQGLAVDE